MKTLAGDIAKANNLPVQEFVATYWFESQGFSSTTIQSKNYLKRDGGQELSFGICQIHLPDHPEISKAEAEDPVWCLNWAAKEWQKGKQNEWTGYRVEKKRKWVME